MRMITLLTSTALVTLGLIAGAQAQDAEAPTEETAPGAEDTSNQGRILETMVVTAQKREENVQNVPISITALSGDALQDIGLTELEQLGEFVPGLQITPTAGEGTQLLIFLRGAGLNDFNTNNAGPIAIYSDEVYISSPSLTPLQFFDMERLEILKGPQGTLYGRNTTGGAIKLISNKPTDEFEFSAVGTYGNFNTSTIEAAVSGPLTENVRARFAIHKAGSDGYGTNLVDGSDTQGVDTLAWRAFIEYDVTENFFLRGNVHGAYVNSPSGVWSHLGIGPGNTDVLGYPGTGEPFEGEYNGLGDSDIDSIGGYLEAQWNLGAVTLTSITAYDEVDRFTPEESDASPFALLHVNFGVESETFTQELRVSGVWNRYTWLLGGYFLTEDLKQDQTVDLFRELRPFTGGLSDPAGEVAGAPILFARALNDQETDAYAIFGQTTIDLTDRLNLTLGGRYTIEQRTFTAIGQLEDEATFGPDPVPVYQFNDLELEDEAFSWRFALDYQARDNVLIYASAARGFKSGGFNGGFLSLDAVEAEVQVQPYEPEFLTAYEIGIKSDFFDNRLRVNGAVFFNDFSDLQVFTLVNTDALPIQVLDNASSAEVWGVELDVTAYPIDGLVMNLAASYLDSELKDFISNAGQDFSGNRTPNTPEYSVSGLVRYDHDLGTYGTAYVQGSFAYRSDIFFSTENNPIVAQDGYTLLNARLGYQSKSGIWGLAVFGNNLSDVAYRNNVVDLTDFGLYQEFFAAPRTYGVELTLDF